MSRRAAAAVVALVAVFFALFGPSGSHGTTLAQGDLCDNPYWGWSACIDGYAYPAGEPDEGSYPYSGTY